MAWFYLALAALFEIIFAMSMKYAEGFTRLLPSAITLASIVATVTFLTLAMRSLPVSVAYPIWTAAGILGTVALGHLLLGEPLTLLKVLSAAAIIAGVVGLKASAA